MLGSRALLRNGLGGPGHPPHTRPGPAAGPQGSAAGIMFPTPGHHVCLLPTYPGCRFHRGPGTTASCRGEPGELHPSRWQWKVANSPPGRGEGEEGWTQGLGTIWSRFVTECTRCILRALGRVIALQPDGLRSYQHGLRLLAVEGHRMGVEYTQPIRQGLLPLSRCKLVV